MQPLTQARDGARDILLLPHLPLLRLKLDFRFDEPTELPPFRGNLWRGMLGTALKQIDAGLRPSLEAGEIGIGALYRSFFESPPPPDVAKMRRYASVPHPYVVDAPGAPGFQRLKPGAQETIGLTLVGRAAGAAEAVLAAFDIAARTGLGRTLGVDPKKLQTVRTRSCVEAKVARGHAHLESARAIWRNDASDIPVFGKAGGFRPVAAEAPDFPPCPEYLHVTLATPLRLVRDGRPLTPRDFSPGLLAANLVRRISMMCAFHGPTPHEPHFRALKALYENWQAAECLLDFADQGRWSGRQKKEIPAGGLIGRFVTDMRGREALFPYLWLGQWLHAGKGAVMGMGAIHLRPE